MRKNLLLILSVLFLVINGLAQTPSIQWQNSYGGSKADQARDIKSTTDGGYIIAGYSYSGMSGHHGTTAYSDFWIVKISSIGTIEWQKSLGGIYNEFAYSIQQINGGYIVLGTTTSNDGNVSGLHGTVDGNPDCWLVQLDNSGNIQWQKTLGGTGSEYASSVQQTSDNGFIVIGFSDLNDGDVSVNQGAFDYWLIKLNSTGDIVWEKSLGGAGDDNGRCIDQTNDGGYIVGGNSYSNNGDVTGNHGNSDYWIVKLDNLGIIQWQKSLGGAMQEMPRSIKQTNDGGYIIAGTSKSVDGDITQHHGTTSTIDFWIVKLDNVGNLEWEKSLGGTLNDACYSVIQTNDGGYLACGGTLSSDGDITNNNGLGDAWIVKMSSSGNIQWQKTLGGSLYDHGYSILQTSDGFIFAGDAQSSDGDVTNNNGEYDYWVVKLNTGVCSANFNLYADVQPLYYIAENLAAGTAPITYEWSWGDGTYDYTAYPSHTYDISGNYTICLSISDATGCTDSYCNDYSFKTESPIAYINVVDPLTIGIGDKQSKVNSLQLYPNPATKILTLETANGTGIYQLQDLTGKVLLSGTISATKFTLDISTLSKGIYLLSLFDGEQQVKRKFVKE